MAWSSNSNYSNSTEGFLFHVSKKTKMEYFANSTNAMYNYSSYGPTWGGGHDLMLCDNCNTTQSSYTNLGHTYKAPNGITYGSTDCQNYLAGSYNFLIDEYEVYKIVVME